MSNTAETAGGPARGYETAADAITHIREQAVTLVGRVNPGMNPASAAFAAKTAEVADAMTRKVCAGLIGQGRPDLARKIRIAWEQSEAAR